VASTALSEPSDHPRLAVDPTKKNLDRFSVPGLYKIDQLQCMRDTKRGPFGAPNENAATFVEELASLARLP